MLQDHNLGLPGTAVVDNLSSRRHVQYSNCMCRSALHLAARAGALDVLEVLLEDLEKADRLEYVNAADKSGITPVFLAKQRGGQSPPAFCLNQKCRITESDTLGSLVCCQASRSFIAKRCSLFFSVFQRATLLRIEVGAGDVCCRQQHNASRRATMQT